MYYTNVNKMGLSKENKMSPEKKLKLERKAKKKDIYKTINICRKYKQKDQFSFYK